MAGFGLLTHPALVNLLEITIDRPGVEIVSDQAVSIKALGESVSATNQASRFELVLTPSPATRINWRPRHRDARSEKPIFYAESVHLFIPTAGLIEGLHEFQIRLAQGQLEQLTFTTPTNVNITDARGDSVINWRFDPDTRKCEVQLRPQARPFAVRLFSQTTTTPLPYTQELGLITVEQAARETALVALGTGNEVQLGTVEVTSLSMINPEDFPSALVNEFSAQVPGLALRRARRPRSNRTFESMLSKHYR
jgi:hypothetical protein